MTTHRALVTLSAILACSAVALAEVPTYSDFELQARSNIVDGYNLPALSSFNSKTPALNDGATIAFSLIVVGAGDAGLFTGAAGAGEVVYSAPTERLLSDVSINASGLVAFDQNDIFSEGIFVYDPGTGMTTQMVPPTTFNLVTGVGLSAGGAIGFRGKFSGGPNSWRLFDTGSSTTYASEGVDSVAFLFTPSTNDAQQIAGKVRLNNINNDAPDEIRLYDGPGSFTVLAEDDDADAGSPFTSFDNSVGLANDGRVAFVAGTTAGDRGVFLIDGTGTTTIATEADADVSEVSFFPPAVNDDGLVAFRGRDGAGLYAIFVGDGTELRRVIGEHDLVEIDLGTARIDQNDNSVTFGGSVAINNHGDVAFNATLTPADDDQIEWGSGMFIAYADSSGDIPTVSPWGLGGMALALLAAAAVLIQRRRRACGGLI